MKRTDLEKLNSKKITHNTTPDRFGKDAGAAAVSRREQRKIDQARGLVPFAVKLDGELVARVHALAQARKTELNDVVAELLRKGLGD